MAVVPAEVLVVSTPVVSLTKVTVKTPRRFIDVALPADVPVADLLPYVLRHAGEDAADAGERHAGWLLRRPTGESLDHQRTLAAQRVLDGELLHLVPGEVEWPELEYEDLVETIASGARRYGRSWGRPATRVCGMVAAAAILSLGTLVVLLWQPPWRMPGVVMIGAAVLLLGGGVLVARAVPDAPAGAVLAGCGLPYAFLGGLLVTAPDHLTLTTVGAPQVMLGASLVVSLGIVGYLGVAAPTRIFVAAVTAAALGVLGAALARPLSPDGAAAVAVTVAIGLMPGFPWLAVRLGRLPLPALPQRSADLLKEQQLPPTPKVFAAAARTDEVLTGLLTGAAVAVVVGAGYLVAGAGRGHLLLLTAAAVALLLRARLFPIPRQRVPLLVAGGALAAMVVGVRAVRADGNGELALLLLGVFAVAVLALGAGLVYARRHPTPYFGRFADVGDVVAVLALVPLTCYHTGFYHYVQTLLAGIR